jgi:small GTP-binding protein
MTTTIINCRNCNQKLRIPVNRGSLILACPSCKSKWKWEPYQDKNESYDSDSKIFDDVYEERQPKFNESINIAVIGKVSTGKSSLINAVMLRGRNDPIVEVGATSGITTKVKAFKLDDHVLIIDSPGLDDIRNENSNETKKFLKTVDLGIFVVTGSADHSQKENYDELNTTANKAIVVLNKIDEWDKLDESALRDIIDQWKEALNVDHIFPTCTQGYDPKMRKDIPMDIRGIEELSEEIWRYLREEGKDLLLARHLGDKRKYAAGIIATALAAVAAEAFIPGSAAYITATQVLAITSLYYLYKGEILSKSSALALLPTFAGQSIGTTIFLWAKSVLPPTGIVDIAAAGIAIGITFSMLAAVNYLLSHGYDIDQREILKSKFNEYQSATPTDFAKKLVSIISQGGSIKDIVYRTL